MTESQINSESKIKIVLLEDDLGFAANLSRELEFLRYEVTHFKTGQSCLQHLANHQHDICLFDWNLPDMPGPQVMERLKKIGRMLPVIFITGNDSEHDITDVLLAGADDYIIKPPVISVLNARIQAILRRHTARATPIYKETLSSLSIDYRHKVITRNGVLVPLTGSEILLAFHFFLHRGQIVSRHQLYEILGIDSIAIDTRRLDVHLSNLRRKLLLNVMNGWRLTSIYQRGYRLELLSES
jgi:two-component system response regulator RegX3